MEAIRKVIRFDNPALKPLVVIDMNEEHVHNIQGWKLYAFLTAKMNLDSIDTVTLPKDVTDSILCMTDNEADFYYTIVCGIVGECDSLDEAILPRNDDVEIDIYVRMVKRL